MGWVKVDQILDLFLPPHCALCGQSIARRPLCQGCLADLPWLEPHDLPAPAGFDQVWSALAYQYPVDRLIAEGGGQLRPNSSRWGTAGASCGKRSTPKSQDLDKHTWKIYN